MNRRRGLRNGLSLLLVQSSFALSLPYSRAGEGKLMTELLDPPTQYGWLQCAQATASGGEIEDFNPGGKVYAEVSEVKRCDVPGDASMSLCVARVVTFGKAGGM